MTAGQWRTIVALVGAAALSAEAPARRVLPRVVANDNRVAAGTLSHDTLTLRLVVQLAEWQPDADPGTTIAVASVAEEGKPPQVPAPLIRVPQGTLVVATVRNALSDSTVRVLGLGAHATTHGEPLVVRPGASQRVEFRSGPAGTYLYGAVLGNHNYDTDDEREQLGGALIVDPPGGSAGDRVFVINIWSETIDSVTRRNALTINGRSWPSTERLDAVVGDTLRWRVVNATNRPHPMHLHGAYFRVDAKGDAFADTIYASSARHSAVTEVMAEFQTMDLSWVPVHEGHWLFHCHIGFHVVPEGARLDAPPPGNHETMSADATRHMAGLVLGINAKRRPSERAAVRGAARRLDLFVQEGSRRYIAARTLGFVLQRDGRAPAPDSVERGSSLIVVHRGEPTDVVIHNRLPEATAVHWHGLELESYSDGVSGWSGVGTRVAPTVSPHGTFTARLTLRRAGTFIYHTHLNDFDQLTSGLYGPLVVLAPGETFDPSTDHLYIAGWDGPADPPDILVNGTATASTPLALRYGVTHRFRFINIGVAAALRFSLSKGAEGLFWKPAAKDGADLPATQSLLRPASQQVNVGETYDFVFRPPARAEYELRVCCSAGRKPWTQRVIVR